MTTTKQKGFDPQAFVERVPKPRGCSIPEWDYADFLMNVRQSMKMENLSDQQRHAVWSQLKLTPEEVDELIRDGNEAHAEAEWEMYGDLFDDRLSARDSIEEQQEWEEWKWLVRKYGK